MAQTSFDGNQIYHSDIGNISNEELYNQQYQISQSKSKFFTFLSEWDVGSVNSYRQQLINCANKQHYFLLVDLEDLNSWNAELTQRVREAPGDYLPVFEEAADDYYVSLQPADAAISKPHFQISLKSNEHPRMLRSLESDLVGKLVVVPGIIVASSKPVIKAKTIVAQCKSCQNKIWIKVGPGFGGVDLPRVCSAPRQAEGMNTEKCPVDPYVVVAEEGEFENQQTLKLQETPDNIPTGEMPRTFTITANQYLVDSCSPGSRVTIVGVFSVFTRNSRNEKGSQTALKQSYVRALGIMTEKGPHSRLENAFTPEEEERFLAMARDQTLYQKLRESIAPSIYGNEDVKAAIACMLFGGSRKTLPDGIKLRGDINVLLLGDPSTAKSQFLKFVERVAPISVYTSGKGSSAAGLTASVNKDPSTGEFQLEGGAMVLADGGIVCIDEFDKMRAQDRVAIHEAMEQQTISVAKAGITTILNSRCSVLAAANPSAGSYNDLKNADEQIDFQTTILSRFDCIFLVRDIRNELNDRNIAMHIMKLHMGGHMDVEETSEIDLTELKKYIAYSRTHCSPRLAEDAGEYLGNLYVQDRQKIAKEESAIPITVRQLEAIIRLSESLARMSLSNTVLAEHVEEAHRIFTVSTLSSATAGMSTSGVTVPEEIAQLIMSIEDAIRRRISIGTRIARNRLHGELLGRFANIRAVDFALHNMIKRDEFVYRDGRRLLERTK